MKKQVGIVDVAQAAGVSPATVSYVLNDALLSSSRRHVIAYLRRLKNCIMFPIRRQRRWYPAAKVGESPC